MITLLSTVSLSKADASLVSLLFSFILFFFNDTATTEIYTLSLHDALPIPSTKERTLARSDVAWAASAKPSSRETLIEPSVSAPRSASSFSISASSESRRFRDWASPSSLSGTGTFLVARREPRAKGPAPPPPGEACHSFEHSTKLPRLKNEPPESRGPRVRKLWLCVQDV